MVQSLAPSIVYCRCVGSSKHAELDNTTISNLNHWQGRVESYLQQTKAVPTLQRERDCWLRLTQDLKSIQTLMRPHSLLQPLVMMHALNQYLLFRL